ncbi:uncharacterized protein LOC135368077 [Ornithodoros turicata]|uniref:uncharacterized protein LOC135368077 n=1 Tax=Ornithodoros turicata TaxID=34597 RepID=UPI0031389A66
MFRCTAVLPFKMAQPLQPPTLFVFPESSDIGGTSGYALASVEREDGSVVLLHNSSRSTGAATPAGTSLLRPISERLTDVGLQNSFRASQCAGQTLPTSACFSSTTAWSLLAQPEAQVSARMVYVPY